ncbi:unnamed protein product [Periconia digitata]|uniref:Uncharacterized protein n=1 Tax=Periconia digitata TaxID=1303443 RepID=A0A9W4U696_9PLEO|nr:unnamed protein product [Periconia digitata]
MFKAQILRRSFSLFRRGPSTSSVALKSARDGHETIRIQRVRFKNPIFTKARIIGTTITFATAYAVSAYVDSVLAEDDEEEEQLRADQAQQGRPRIDKGSGQDAAGKDEEGEWEQQGDEEEDDDEDDEDEEVLFFFPTGLSKPKPRTFYKGSDPEWQEFIKFAPDRQRIVKIRNELISTVRGAVIKNDQWTKVLGKINAQTGNTWLEVIFPDAPPIEYERPGWALTTDLNLRQATQDIDPRAHSLYNRVLFPIAIARAFYEDSWRRISKMWETQPGLGGTEAALQAMIRARQITSGSTPPTSPTSASASPTSTPTSEQQAAMPRSPPSSDPAHDRSSVTLQTSKMIPIMDMSFFRGKWLKNRPREQPQPPRGTFVVSGLIDIVGDKAKMTVDVFAAYDPKSAKYVIITIKPRTLKEWTQRPKGGPG